VPPAGQIYVADAANNSIFVYAPNPSGTLNETPLATITGSNTGLLEPQGIALDASGRIYVANDFPNAPGAAAGILSPGGTVTVYAANPSGTLNEAPLATLTIVPAAMGLSALGFPAGVAVDAGGKIYVANSDVGIGGGGLEVFAANPSGTSAAPLASFDLVGVSLSGIALDAAGNIYGAIPVPAAGVPTEVVVYAANPSGAAPTVISTITGSSTGLNFPYGIALDSTGKIYVANLAVAATTSSITVYAANPSGTLNEAPLATISGSSTGLVAPTAVALDASGKIYVANANSSITVYGPNPSGTLNEAPIATIAGSNTGLSSSNAFLNMQQITIAVH
jgi:hypothetical protein